MSINNLNNNFLRPQPDQLGSINGDQYLGDIASYIKEDGLRFVKLPKEKPSDVELKQMHTDLQKAFIGFASMSVDTHYWLSPHLGPEGKTPLEGLLEPNVSLYKNSERGVSEVNPDVLEIGLRRLLHKQACDLSGMELTPEQLDGKYTLIKYKEALRQAAKGLGFSEEQLEYVGKYEFLMNCLEQKKYQEGLNGNPTKDDDDAAYLRESIEYGEGVLNLLQPTNTDPFN